MQLSDDWFALDTYPKTVQDKAASNDCQPQSGSSYTVALAIGAWGYVAKPRFRVDLVLQLMSGGLAPETRSRLTTTTSHSRRNQNPYHSDTHMENR